MCEVQSEVVLVFINLQHLRIKKFIKCLMKVSGIHVKESPFSQNRSLHEFCHLILISLVTLDTEQWRVGIIDNHQLELGVNIYNLMLQFLMSSGLMFVI